MKKCHYFNNQKICPFEQIGCMFLHLPAGECRNSESCTMKLCSFEHKNIKVNEKETVKKSEMTKEQQNFDINVQKNFPDIFENYLQNKRTIQCYYCDFRSESKILSNIKDEVKKHLEIEHKEVINTFEAEEMVVENLWHAEFLEFFVTD